MNDTQKAQILQAMKTVEIASDQIHLQRVNADLSGENTLYEIFANALEALNDLVYNLECAMELDG